MPANPLSCQAATLLSPHDRSWQPVRAVSGHRHPSPNVSIIVKQQLHYRLMTVLGSPWERRLTILAVLGLGVGILVLMTVLSSP